MSFFPKQQQNERRSHEQMAEQLWIALQTIEHHRSQLDHAAANLKRLLRDADLHKLWSKFALAGGFSSNDFASFIEGRFRCRRIRQRRHLRLVSDWSRKTEEYR
jgi:hypothetical protein